MRHRNAFILAVIGSIIFFFCLEGWGADWKSIGEDTGGNQWEIDMAASLVSLIILQEFGLKRHIQNKK